MVNRDLFKEALRIKYYIIAVIIIGVTTGVIAVFQAKTLSVIINSVFINKFPLEKIWTWVVTLLIFILSRGILILLIDIFSSFGAVRVKYNLRQKLQKSIFTAGPVAMRNENQGEILNLTLEGIEALDSYFSEYLPQLAISILTPILILFFIFPLDPLSALIMLITAPLIPAFMILIGKYANNLSLKQWESLSKLGGHFLDMLNGLPTLKMFGRSKSQSKVIYKFSENLRKDTLSVLRIAFLSALTLELLATLSTAIIAVTLGLRLVYGKITFLDGFFLLLLVPEYYQPLRQLGAKFHSGMNGNAAAKDIFRFLKKYSEVKNKEVDIKDLIHLKTDITEIKFKDVSFNYEENKDVAINSISFLLKKGQFTALVGESGSGKTTILNLLLGFLKPKSGKIFINGFDLNKISIEDFRQSIGFISQQPFIFSGTILENIKIAFPEAEFDEILSASKQSGAHDFISKFKTGYETKVGEGRISLSGGEKQLLAITRIFLKNPSLIIMDEPTASLDSDTEKNLIQVIKKLTQNRTILLVTHNLDLIKEADQILVLKSANLVETGTHIELIKNNITYSRLMK